MISIRMLRSQIPASGQVLVIADGTLRWSINSQRMGFHDDPFFELFWEDMWAITRNQLSWHLNDLLAELGWSSVDF